MLTGMLAVRNILLGENNDLWSVNADAEYHEEIRRDGTAAPVETLEQRIPHIFPRLDPVALGVAIGTTAGSLIFMATLFLTFSDARSAVPYLALLSNFLPGFTVTVPGAVLGLLGLFILGFLVGSMIAYLRNLAVFLTARLIHRDIELYHLRRLFDLI